MSVVRIFSLAVLAFALLSVASTTSAQSAVYGTGASNKFGFSGQNYSGGTSLKPSTPGFTVGAFYTLPGVRRLRSGFDARYTSSSSYNGGKAYTGAIRLSWIPYRFPLRPYADFGGGMASTQLHQNLCNGFGCGQTTTHLSSGVVQFGGGLDIHLHGLFDLRAVDYQYDTGGAAGMTHTAMRSLSSGIVFRIPTRRAGYP